MVKEKTEVLPWGSAWGNQEEGKWLDCPKSSDAGCRKVDDTPYDVLCKLAYKWHQVLSESGGGGCLFGRITSYSVNLAELGSNTVNTARLFSLMRLTSTPTNQGMVPGVSPKYRHEIISAE